MLKVENNNKKSNVYHLNSGKALRAIKLMHEREKIEQIKNPEDRVLHLIIWKDKAEKYWGEFS